MDPRTVSWHTDGQGWAVCPAPLCDQSFFMPDTSTKERNRPAEVRRDEEGGVLRITGSGAWTLVNIADVDGQLRNIPVGDHQRVLIDTSNVDDFDTAGAWMVERLRRTCEAANVGFEHVDDSPERRKLVDVVRPHPSAAASRPGFLRQMREGILEKTGYKAYKFARDVILICNMVGAAIRGPQMKAGKSGGIRLVSIVNQLDHMCLRAIPVIAVMAFLIGAIIAQQGAFQLKWRKIAMYATLIFMVGIALGRVVSILLDGMPEPIMLGYLGLEIVLAIALWQLIKNNSNA